MFGNNGAVEFSMQILVDNNIQSTRFLLIKPQKNSHSNNLNAIYFKSAMILSLKFNLKILFLPKYTNDKWNEIH